MMLLKSADVPVLLRRSHIVSGYRPPNQPFHYYLKSAFQLHNELINFWTHLIPLFGLYFFYISPELALSQPRLPLLCLYFGVCCLFFGSSFTHLMHSRSHLDHVFWLLADFSGIAIFALCVGVQRFSCRNHNSFAFTLFYLPSLFIIVFTQYISTCGLFVMRPYWKARQLIRLISCLTLAIWLYIPLFDRYIESLENDKALNYHNRAFFWLVFSGFFMSANFPERLAPGLFDLFGYGHQLFHICIFMVTWEVCEAAKLDCPLMDPLMGNSTTTQNFIDLKQKVLRSPHFAHKHPFMASIIIWIIITSALIVVCGCIMHLMRHVKRNLKTEKSC